MNLSRFFLHVLAVPLRLGGRSAGTGSPRILVIRPNRMGDMIYTLPLLHALRRRYPQAYLAVACDAPGAPIARACAGVNEVIVLKGGWNRWLAVVLNAARLQGYDDVVAAKGGFDRRLALLARLTNAPTRIGFVEGAADRPSNFYTDSVALPEKPHEEHQIETLMRLLAPLELTDMGIDLSLNVPDSAREFAVSVLARRPFTLSERFILINRSSTAPLKFRDEDFIKLITQLLGSTEFAIGLVAAPADQEKSRVLAERLASSRVVAVETPGALDLAALLERAAFLLTPEGGAAHLAAAVGTPALVIWSEGPFKKWYSRGEDHAFVHAEQGEEMIPAERVWRALQPFLEKLKKAG